MNKDNERAKQKARQAAALLNEVELAKKFALLLEAISKDGTSIVVGEYNGVPWFFENIYAVDLAGIIPTFLSVADERSLKDQLDAEYVGGWREFKGHDLNLKDWSLHYPGDPPMHPVGACALNGSILALYQYAWVLVMDTAGWEVCRMD